MIEYERYRGAGVTYLAVDATNYVRDRRAFAVQHCDPEKGVSGPGGCRGASGVLFLALESEFRPSRVVLTLICSDGELVPECPDATRCAAAWAARRVAADRFMIDTQAGTREAVVHGDTAAEDAVEVSVEVEQARVLDAEHGSAQAGASRQPAIGVTDGGHDARTDPGTDPGESEELAEPAFTSPEDAFTSPEDELIVTRGPAVRESNGEVPEVET